jgi:hypothetical protein
MASVMRRVVLALTGMTLAFAAAGSIPALAATTTQHSPGSPASGQGHLTRMRSMALYQGEELLPGDYIDSGTVTLIMQYDGDLVLYPDGHVFDRHWALWDSDTWGDNTAVMQTDGNFVIYPSDRVDRPYWALWSTDTRGNNVLEVQPDGNVVIYASWHDGDPAGAEWQTDTAF